MMLWLAAGAWLALAGGLWSLDLTTLAPYCLGAAGGTVLGQLGLMIYRRRTN